MEKRIRRITVIVLSVFILCMLGGCAKKKPKKPEFASKGAFEAAVTIAFQSYGIIGAQIPNDSNLMVMYAKGDFAGTYQQNEAELQTLFRTWLGKLHDFKTNDETVGILVREGLTEVFHASRDKKGKVFFQIMGQ